MAVRAYPDRAELPLECCQAGRQKRRNSLSTLFRYRDSSAKRATASHCRAVGLLYLPKRRPNRSARREYQLRVGTARSTTLSNRSHRPRRGARLVVSGAGAAAREEVTAAVQSLAEVTLALLAGDEAAARGLVTSVEQKRETIRLALAGYDVCASGTLSREEARALFTELAQSIVRELATSEAARPVARVQALRVLEDDKRGTIARVATKLMLLADADGDGRVSLTELAGLFDTVHSSAQRSQAETFPQPLRALAGSLQLLPPTEGTDASHAERAAEWHVGVPGDDHTLRRVAIGRGLSVVGLGRSADASAYFVPELRVVFDAGIQVKSLQPKSVFLTHGHRDHTAALPAMALNARNIYAPAPIVGLVRRFLLAEAQLNYGDAGQTDAETVAALGDMPVAGVADGDCFELPREAYSGSPTPVGLQVVEAPHKTGIPAVAYGLYRAKSRLKPEYAALPKHELGALLRADVAITEPYHEGILFYSGDTTIELLRHRHTEILPKYPAMIHEVTFFGPPTLDLDASSSRKGHTHYAQLHPFISAFPETTFILVHWSLRYSKDDIIEFFRESYGGVPKNVVLWV